MKADYLKGFTLIELIVVTGIIGLLASIVLVSLNLARTRGKDAAIQANLANIRSYIELYYSNHSNTYASTPFVSATCPTIPTSGNIFSDENIIREIDAAALSGGNGTRCAVTSSSYAIAVGLTTAGKTWCIDSQGASKEYNGTPETAITGGVCS